jgi:HEXXH motif-containing protein
MELANHTLAAEDFTGLASGAGNSSTLERLSAAEFSRRFVLLRMLFDLVAERPDVMGDLPPVEHAWKALEQAQGGSPKMLQAVLMSPQIGVWLSRMVRILRTEGIDPGSLWPEIGHMHALAFAVAVRSGTTLSTSIPVRDGNAMVPTLGMVHLPLGGLAVATAVTSQGRAHVRCGEHDVRLPADPAVDAPGWWSLRACS